MKRIDIEELHEQAWLPGILRDYMTDALQFVMGVGGVYRPAMRLLIGAVDSAGARRLVDLCSGGGGPWPWLYKSVTNGRGGDFHIVLTDKYPNLPAFEKARADSNGAIDFWPGPVEASHMPENLTGFRTMFTSFHHFTPEQASNILRGAVEQRQGIGVFDLPRRSLLTILMVFVVPLAALLTAPFMQPFRWTRLFWTYVIPVVPFMLWYDGILSCLRAYTPSEMKQLSAEIGAEDYTWEAGETGRLVPVTYLLGYPSSGAPPAAV
jgi:hypothetical protein